VDFPLLPWSALPCRWDLSFPGLLKTDAGSFTPATLRSFGLYSPRPDTPSPQLSAGPSPSARPFEPDSAVAPRQRSAAFCFGRVPEYPTPLRLLAPPRLQLRSRFYPHLPPGALGRGWCSLLPALSSAGVTPSHPYLPLGQCQVSLGHLGLFPTVSPAHTVVRWEGTLRLRLPSAGSTLPQLWPTGSSLGSLPRLRPGGSPQALQTSPHGERPALRSLLGGGCRSVLAVSSFRLRARLDFSLPSSCFGQ
jgi:hypothetical protein